MELILKRIPVSNAAEVADAIRENDDYCYLCDSRGSAFLELVLVETTLSDGSKVKDFRLR